MHFKKIINLLLCVSKLLKYLHMCICFFNNVTMMFAIFTHHLQMSRKSSHSHLLHFPHCLPTRHPSWKAKTEQIRVDYVRSAHLQRPERLYVCSSLVYCWRTRCEHDARRVPHVIHMTSTFRTSPLKYDIAELGK